MNSCKARRYSDQMICDRCSLQWDINDIDPPKCLTNKERATEAIKGIRKMLAKKCKK